ncbi:MAG TPA: efflux RND transporter periplasmic adaptor subunit [Candidatus Sulfotelmatobacter sp.]|nr:efflux RND transporter periplasmic adaptor subunit [Candidatus Sulfotelmatobacter sp.]
MNAKNTGLRLGNLIVAAVLGLSSCSTERQADVASTETVRNASVLAVRQANIPDVLDAVGTVRAAQTSDLASQMMGNIVEIRAREGDRVYRGQVLAVIDDSQPRATVDRATAAELAAQQQLVAADSDLALAESTLKRCQYLYEQKVVSQQEFDEVKARHQATLARRDLARAGQAEARAALHQAMTSLEYTRIRAPFNGVVTHKQADSGTLASPGMPIFTVEDVSGYRLEVAVNESDLRYARTGGEVLAAIEALGNAELKGKVVQIVPAADAASRAFLVKIELPTDTRLHSGLFGRAQFSRGKQQALLIPRSAVIERGQLQGVFVLDQNRVASLRYVTLGKFSGSEIEVLSGLQGGEWLVANPAGRDLNSKRIEGE